MKGIGLMMVALVTATALSAQTGKINRGNKYYEKFLYRDAIYVYEGVKSKNADVLRNLADSYRHIRNSGKAEFYYEQLSSTGNASVEDLWNYADALKMNGKYSEAIKIIDQINAKSPGQKRCESHLSNRNYYNDLMKDNDSYKIKSLANNTMENDFGTSYFHGQVIFVSSKPVYGVTAYTDNGTGKRYTNLYAGTEHEGGKGPELIHIHPLKVKTGIAKKYNEGPATFSPDGNTMIFTRNSYSKKSELNGNGERVLELWMSKRGIHGEWLKPTALPFNSKDYNVCHPAIDADGETLYFVSDMPGGLGGKDIWKVNMTKDGGFEQPENMGDKVNTEADEMFPFAHEENVLFFASNGHAGLGGLDIFFTTINHGTPGKIENMGAPINSNGDDFSLILDHSKKKGYFSSNRAGGKGGDDIYQVILSKELKYNKTIIGVVRDDHTKDLLKGAVIKLLDENLNVISETITDENGNYSLDAEPNKNYTVVAELDNYYATKVKTNTKTENNEVVADVEMGRKATVSLACKVLDQRKYAPLENVTIRITDKQTGKIIFDVLTDEDGEWRAPLPGIGIGAELNYTVYLEKDGFVEKTLDWKYKVERDGEVKLHELLDFTMGTIEIGADLGKLLNLKPIYFDVAKWDIRPEAAHELDKIVDVMKKHPHIKIELDSHTDCDGSTKSNHDLSQKRANASVDYIVSKGIAKDRITGVGYGEEKPAVDCNCSGPNKCTDAQKQLNRRTEFVIKQGD